jgi:hypothetical protein
LGKGTPKTGLTPPNPGHWRSVGSGAEIRIAAFERTHYRGVVLDEAVDPHRSGDDFTVGCTWNEYRAHPTIVDVFHFGTTARGAELLSVAHDVAIHFHDSHPSGNGAIASMSKRDCRRSDQHAEQNR